MSPAWAQRFRFAVTRLGLSPAAFWALTLAEWRALTAAAAAPPPLSREGLDALLAAHPDLKRPGEADD